MRAKVGYIGLFVAILAVGGIPAVKNDAALVGLLALFAVSFVIAIVELGTGPTI